MTNVDSFGERRSSDKIIGCNAYFSHYFYLSIPRKKDQSMYIVSGLFFWLGIIQEADLFNIVPIVNFSFGWENLVKLLFPVLSNLTWIIYTLTTLVIAITAFYLVDINSGRPSYTPHIKIYMVKVLR